MKPSKDAPCWFALLGNQLNAFIKEPSGHHQTTLTHSMQEYKADVAAGLQIPQFQLREPWRRAKNLNEWIELQLRDGLAMFEKQPTVERFMNVSQLLEQYRDIRSKHPAGVGL